MNEFEKRNYKPLTLCELCTKACGFCTWSERGVQKPVEGWKAIRRDLLGVGESYLVLECPEFDLEERHRWAYEKFDPEWIKRQSEAVQRQQETARENHRRRAAR